MRFLLSAALGVLSLLSIAADDPAKDTAKPEDFLGKWTGRWDRKWVVQLTVTQDPKTKDLSAVYEYEENEGEPLSQCTLPAILKGKTLIIGNDCIIEMTISAKDPNKAKAIGDFRDQLVANLVRAVEKEKKPGPGGTD